MLKDNELWMFLQGLAPMAGDHCIDAQGLHLLPLFLNIHYQTVVIWKW